MPCVCTEYCPEWHVILIFMHLCLLLSRWKHIPHYTQCHMEWGWDRCVWVREQRRSCCRESCLLSFTYTNILNTFSQTDSCMCNTVVRGFNVIPFFAVHPALFSLLLHPNFQQLSSISPQLHSSSFTLHITASLPPPRLLASFSRFYISALRFIFNTQYISVSLLCCFFL